MQVTFTSYLLGILVTALGIQFLLAGAVKLRARMQSPEPTSPSAHAAIVGAVAEMVGGVGLMLGIPVASVIVVVLIMVTTALSLVRAAELDNPHAAPGTPEVDELSMPAVLRNFVQAVLAMTPLIFPVATRSWGVLICAALVYGLSLSIATARTRRLALQAE